jgi:hypothetical protein
MSNLGDAFSKANDRCRQRAHQRSHHHQRKQQILRSQVGFGEIMAIHPVACTGCRYYHDQSASWQQDQRQTLICALHPYGWENSASCPDWAMLEPASADLPTIAPAAVPAIAR